MLCTTAGVLLYPRRMMDGRAVAVRAVHTPHEKCDLKSARWPFFLKHRFVFLPSVQNIHLALVRSAPPHVMYATRGAGGV